MLYFKSYINNKNLKGDNVIYLDNAATTPVSDEIINLVADVLKNKYANPSAVYRAGMESEDAIDVARRNVAAALSVKPSRVFFTSGGTESNNIGLSGLYYARRGWAKNVVISGYEHPSVSACVEHLSLLFGVEVRKVMPSSDGNINPNNISEVVDDKTALVAVMQVNNETGAVFNLASLTNDIKKKNSRTAIFCDGIQGFLKINNPLIGRTIDGYSLSGHKLGAPKGVGALYLKDGINYEPAVNGGGQEGGIRSGTENIAYIVALGELCKKLASTTEARYKSVVELRRSFLEGLAGLDYIINSPVDGSPYILNLSFKGTKSAVLQRALDEVGIMLSSGSSCSKGNRSKTLMAMTLPNERIDSAIRISFSADNTIDQCKTATELIGAAIDRIIKV